MGEHLLERMRAPGPKRMLALDGGGTRGIISIAFLEDIERTLQTKLGRGDDFVLAEYFDMIGGTSVGSILATLLALGWRVEKIRDRFEKWAPQIFSHARRIIGGTLVPHYDARVLRGFIQSEVLDWPLKSEKLKTGLCIVTKRVDTGSVWVFTNNPSGPFFKSHAAEEGRPKTVGIGDYKLLDIIRASTAAPSFFSPSKIRIYDGPEEGLFVDGGVSPHNNPALQMVMLAGLKGYNLNWPLGAENLLVVSVGTGTYAHLVGESISAGLDAVEALKGLITDGQDLALTLLQWMSASRRPWQIDRAVGNLSGDCLGREQGLAQPLISFSRYDVGLEQDWLARELGETLSPAEMKPLWDFTSAKSMPTLYRLAKAASKMQVSVDDFPQVFDKLWRPAAAA
jgi:hypothetical protein